MVGRIIFNSVFYGQYGVFGAQHSYFYSLGHEIRKHTVQLGGQKLRGNRTDHLHAECILGGDGGNDAGGVETQRRDGFNICLDTGPAAGV